MLHITMLEHSWGPSYWHISTLIQGWISYHVASKVWHEINLSILELWECITHSLPHFILSLSSLSLSCEVIHLLSQANILTAKVNNKENNEIWYYQFMMMASDGNIFCVAGPFCGEFTSHRWIPLTKASHAELWFFVWSAPKQTVE